MKKYIYFIILMIFVFIAYVSYISNKLMNFDYDINNFKLDSITKNKIKGNFDIIITNPLFFDVDLDSIDIDLFLNDTFLCKITHNNLINELIKAKSDYIISLKFDTIPPIKLININLFKDILSINNSMLKMSGYINISKFGFKIKVPLIIEDNLKNFL